MTSIAPVSYTHLDVYKRQFIDCPPSLGLLTLNCLCAADSFLVPLQCEYYALEGLSQLMTTVRMVKKSMNPGLTLEGVLLTMFDGRTNLSIQAVSYTHLNGVTTYSTGTEPGRRVVIAPDSSYRSHH